MDCIPKYTGRNIRTILVYNDNAVKGTCAGLQKFDGTKCTPKCKLHNQFHYLGSSFLFVRLVQVIFFIYMFGQKKNIVCVAILKLQLPSGSIQFFWILRSRCLNVTINFDLRMGVLFLCQDKNMFITTCMSTMLDIWS